MSDDNDVAHEEGTSSSDGGRRNEDVDEGTETADSGAEFDFTEELGETAGEDDHSDGDSGGACAIELDGDEADGAVPVSELGFDPVDPDRPVLIWDGTCGFCKRSLEYVRDRVGDAIHSVPYQKVHEHFDELEASDFEREVHLVEPDGWISSGADAIYRSLSYAPDGGMASTLYDAIPPFAYASERGYRFVAEHRPLVSKVSRWFVGEDLRRSRFRIARWLFFRGLALVSLIAFVSLGVQILGLVGSEGIVPAIESVEQFREANQQPGRSSSVFWSVPTLFWWIDPTDAALVGTCVAGGLLAVLLLVGAWHRGALLAIWALYLSLATVSNPFLGYQWDTLLLEASFLGLFLAPAGFWRPRGRSKVSRLGLFLLAWLAFRLFFMSGVVKLASGDPTWWDGTALTYHFWTQPLPTWTAFYVDRLPEFVLWLGTNAALVVELAIPFLLFGPRRCRRFAAYLFLGLQAAIFATGNYGFFNILSAAICLLLIDDFVWRAYLPQWFLDWYDAEPARPSAAEEGGGENWGVAALVRSTAVRRTTAVLVAVPILGVTTVTMFERFQASEGAPFGLPEPVMTAVHSVDGFRTLNNYGLFADMTTDRPEIIVQGSNDGKEWETYEFRWKPDDPAERPRFVEPHQPRLDWQMWFQALRLERYHDRRGGCGYGGWFVKFQRRLLEGSEPVLNLLATNPFDGEPPKFVRTVLYDYEFAGPDEPADRWWRRTGARRYCPALTLVDGRLRPARNPDSAGGNGGEK